MDNRTLAILAAPVLSFATLAVGLGLGASGETTAAIIEGAAPGSNHAGIAWQARVYRADRGVREVVPNLRIHVHAKYKDQERTADLRTTPDGAAEIVFDFAGITSGDDVAIDVTSDDGRTTLAEGEARVPESIPRTIPSGTLPALQKKGPASLEVVIDGGSLPVDLWTNLWVRATNAGKAIPRDTIVQLDAMDGLEVDTSSKRVSEVAPQGAQREDWSPICGDGWALFPVRAHATNLQARFHLGDAQWIGILPTMLGATVARETARDEKTGARMLEVTRAVSQETNVYVEVDDDAGRLWAATPTLRVDTDGFARAKLPLPDLNSKSLWATASSEPNGAERILGGTTSRPLGLVPDAPAPCVEGPLPAAFHPVGFPRAAVLDGFIAARARTAARRKKGMSIAIGALVIGAIVEVLIVLRGAARGRTVNAPWITGKTGSILIGMGLAVLGFSMLAAFVLTH